MQIRIYDRTMSPLTTLFITENTSDFNALTYRDVLMGIGDASFVMRLDSEKCTQANIQHYNIIEIREDDGTPRWIGLIVNKKITFNLVTVSCYGLLHILSKRLTGAAENYNDQTGDIATTLLANANSAENTNVIAGTLDEATTVQITFNHSSLFDALKKLCESSSGQFILNPDRSLDVRSQIGTDKSSTVFFQYQIGLIASANIMSFNVDDNGGDIVTTSYGESNANSSTQADAPLVASFGLLEDYNDFREIDDQTSLDTATANNNRGSEFSPEITLLPTVSDDFEVGDIVRVKLKNRLIDIDDSYQITEKTVAIKGGNQKQISIRVISNLSDFMRQLREMKAKINLLERSV